MARSLFASSVACGRSLRRRAASANEGASRIFLLCAGDANETATFGDQKDFFFYKTRGEPAAMSSLTQKRNALGRGQVPSNYVPG